MVVNGGGEWVTMVVRGGEEWLVMLMSFRLVNGLSFLVVMIDADFENG